ncbi:beta-galactosidase [Streptomyces luteogriseus]|uniref:beta-galactosidase n=1 Tax=Streptomyces luteogriseus TaxID=68233 RepID=UPI0036CFD79B
MTTTPSKPQEVRDEDHRLFTRAGVDTLTVGVFTWSVTQPGPDPYDFTVLDRILDRAAAEGRRVCLATGTAALPPWLATSPGPPARPEPTWT